MKFLVLAFLLSFSAFADDHTLSNLKGGDVELKVYDHALSGSVKDFVIFANKNEETGVTTLLAKREGKVLTTEIKKQDNGTFGTELNYTTATGEARSVSVTFVSLDKVENIFTFSMNGKLVKIKVSADEFRDNHFIHPTFDFNFGDKNLVIKMDKADACYNFSAHIIATILTAYLM